MNKENQIISIYKINGDNNNYDKDYKFNLLNYFGNNIWENDRKLNN